MTEAQFQASIVQQLKWCLPVDADYQAVPNGGHRHDKVGAILAGQGVRAGAPDLEVYYQGRVIFIELKTPVGVVSMVQKQRHTKLRGCGCPVYVCSSPEAVWSALKAEGVPLNHSMARP